MGRTICKDCQHYNDLRSECRRNPPVPVIINQQGTVAGMWPAAMASDWCGGAKPVEVATLQ